MRRQKLIPVAFRCRLCGAENLLKVGLESRSDGLFCTKKGIVVISKRIGPRLSFSGGRRMTEIEGCKFKQKGVRFIAAAQVKAQQICGRVVGRFFAFVCPIALLRFSFPSVWPL